MHQGHVFERDIYTDLCRINSVSNSYQDFLTKNDLIIFPIFEELDSSVLAAAKICLTNDDNRPIIGVLKINTENDNTTLNKTLYMKKAIFHEITHLLGFTFGILESLNMIEKENGIYYVNSSNVVMHAQKHFNCSNITKLPLENGWGEGSANSHWESRYMYGDYMIFTLEETSIISDMTLALLEDTGFYQVNYY